MRGRTVLIVCLVFVLLAMSVSAERKARRKVKEQKVREPPPSLKVEVRSRPQDCTRKSRSGDTVSWLLYVLLTNLSSCRCIIPDSCKTEQCLILPSVAAPSASNLDKARSSPVGNKVCSQLCFLALLSSHLLFCHLNL